MDKATGQHNAGVNQDNLEITNSRNVLYKPRSGEATDRVSIGDG